MQSKNYIIHGDAGEEDIECNFFAQLKNMMSHSEEEETGENENEDNCCLLTKEPLQYIHIVLSCGHKFNYVPIYREVIAQKTIGISSTGYYTSNSLKRNEIKCPYCRNVQDKLLPYLEFNGVKKTVNVNYPVKMSMTSQPCMHTHSHSTFSKKGKILPCKDYAVEYCNGMYVCKKHYETSLTALNPVDTNAMTKTTVPPPTSSQSPSKCGVILRYGKNKGNPCTNSSSCRVHSAHKINQTADASTII